MTDVDEPSEINITQLWRSHSTELLRYATLLVGPHDANDLVAGAFAKIGPSSLGQIMNPRAYLFRVVANLAFDQRRSQKRRQVRDLHALLPTSGGAMDSQLDVRRAVAALSVQQRAVVYFAYWEDLDAPAIAEILDIAPGTVRRHLANARHRLRKELS